MPEHGRVRQPDSVKKGAVSTVIEVCAAVVRRTDDCFLAARRPAGTHLAGKWEFPGGKVHSGETREACLRRELHEELGIEIDRIVPLTSIRHEYPEKTVRIHFIACEPRNGSEPEARDHDRIGWFSWEEIRDLDLADADRLFVARQTVETSPAPARS